MNISFPVLYPRLVDPKWFNADSPCDEDAEITGLEQKHQEYLNNIGQQYMKRAVIGKSDPEPMEEEADSDEEGNDESDESEESHDEDEEEELRTTYSPTRNNNEPDSLEDLNEAPDNNTYDRSYNDIAINDGYI